MTARVLILGAGFGGLEAAATLSERLGNDVEVTIIDRRDGFVFGFDKLDVLFAAASADEVSHSYDQVSLPGVRFVQAEVTRIDPEMKRVETTAGEFDGDYLIVALGADLDMDATEGLAESSHEFYSNSGAFAAREKLAEFTGGRIVVGASHRIFKCPPAPSETALLVHDHLVRRGLRDASQIALVLPMAAPVPPVPEASDGLLAAFAERGIEWHPQRVIERVERAESRIVFDDGSAMPFDLFLSVPVHAAAAVTVSSGMTAAGWVSVDPVSFATKHPGVYAVGDVVRCGTPKAGVFAEGQGRVVAEQIAADVDGGPGPDGYDGAGVCYVGFGGDDVARLDVEFPFGAPPRGSFAPASVTHARAKEAFRADRLTRWFGGSGSTGA